MAHDAAHWDTAYGARDEESLTWFEGKPEVSLELIGKYAPLATIGGGAIVDVGAGASRLVDRLLGAGFAPVCAVDLSAAALAISKARLGAAGDAVDWVVGDVTQWQPARTYDVWHDRAVFHFLTSAAARAGYVAALLRAVPVGGVAIIASFALDGPEKCSGLPVVRYSPQSLLAELLHHAPAQFELTEGQAHVHHTPKGREQAFQVSVFRRT